MADLSTDLEASDLQLRFRLWLWLVLGPESPELLQRNTSELEQPEEVTAFYYPRVVRLPRGNLPEDHVSLFLDGGGSRHAAGPWQGSEPVDELLERYVHLAEETVNVIEAHACRQTHDRLHTEAAQGSLHDLVLRPPVQGLPGGLETLEPRPDALVQLGRGRGRPGRPPLLGRLPRRHCAPPPPRERLAESAEDARRAPQGKEAVHGVGHLDHDGRDVRVRQHLLHLPQPPALRLSCGVRAATYDVLGAEDVGNRTRL
mmetsp:Transcript_45767/g.130620  ORF Transcript_45767/g.130620 Transcript_45767/m.130620 type:complete len:258 (+) Transcript_45767:908-1681(+)